LRIKGAASIYVVVVYDVTRLLACVNLFFCWLLISLVLRLPDLGDHLLFIHIFVPLSDIRSMTSTWNKGSWRRRLVQGMNHVNFSLVQNTISYYTAQTNSLVNLWRLASLLRAELVCTPAGTQMCTVVGLHLHTEYFRQ
jgi:hypothetical protein